MCLVQKSVPSMYASSHSWEFAPKTIRRRECDGSGVPTKQEPGESNKSRLVTASVTLCLSRACVAWDPVMFVCKMNRLNRNDL